MALYLIPEMVKMGLAEGQTFPTESHRIVAENLIIGNASVGDKDTLTNIVQSVLKVPNKEIELVSYSDLVVDYGMIDFAGLLPAG